MRETAHATYLSHLGRVIVALSITGKRPRRTARPAPFTPQVHPTDPPIIHPWPNFSSFLPAGSRQERFLPTGASREQSTAARGLSEGL